MTQTDWSRRRRAREVKWLKKFLSREWRFCRERWSKQEISYSFNNNKKDLSLNQKYNNSYSLSLVQVPNTQRATKFNTCSHDIHVNNYKKLGHKDVDRNGFSKRIEAGETRKFSFNLCIDCVSDWISMWSNSMLLSSPKLCWSYSLKNQIVLTSMPRHQRLYTIKMNSSAAAKEVRQTKSDLLTVELICCWYWETSNCWYRALSLSLSLCVLSLLTAANMCEQLSPLHSDLKKVYFLTSRWNDFIDLVLVFL